MGLKDLDGKRTGRPRGARTASRVRRDILWAYRHLDKPDAQPPSAGARLWAALAREHPARFLACVARLEATAPPEGQRPGEAPGRTGNPPSGGPAGGSAVDDARPRRAVQIFVPEQRLAQCLGGEQRWLRITNLPTDCLRILASRADPDQRGVWLTVESPAFAPVPAGAPIPELRACWLRDPQTY
jgi:hypothetical protein